ncbi:MAG: ASCH domain-containing protein [Bacilli bacterium]
MKVISIKEPWATLIKNKKKFIETRSWKTNYRGELFIHASLSKIKNNILKDKLLKDIISTSEMNYGYIICKCKLVDCIYMDEKFLKDIKLNKKEYICGEYSLGRYAWILKNIEVLKEPIKAKGSLNIWNYYNETEIMTKMNKINYGWMDYNHELHNDIDDSYSNHYILQTRKEILKNNVGVCWDQVELERYYFRNNNWDIKTYFIAYYDNDKYPTHTFLTYKKNNKFYWFEHSWELFKSIHEYSSLKELLTDVQQKYIKNELNNNCIKENLVIREYKKPKDHISVLEFYKHCERGKLINIDKL